MPVLNEDTFALLSFVERNEPLYNDCFRIASLALERHPPTGPIRLGVATVATEARAELTEILRNVIVFSDDKSIVTHLGDAKIHWADVARELIADVLTQPKN